MTFTRRQSLKAGGTLSVFAAIGACTRSGASGETNIDAMDAVETAFRISQKDITASEATEAAIARAELINPKINGIVTKTYDEARKNAADPKAGPFGGVPTFVKDLNDVIGIATGNGSNAFKDHIARSQFPFVSEFERNGFISLGKSSTPEFGLTATTVPASSGVTRNPWNLNHSTGGSTGGASAFLAAGVVPLAHASDGGGSIRIPASCCGTVGLKVSNDRYPLARDESKIPVRISVQGCETRTVRDTAAFLAAMELRVGPLPEVGMVTEPARKRLKIGFFTATPTGVAVSTEVVVRTKEAAALCETLGHKVEEMVAPFNDEIADDFLLYWAAFASSAIERWEKAAGITATEAHFERFTFGLRDHFVANQEKMRPAILKLIGFAQVYRETIADYDLILSPVLTTPPPEIGYLDTSIDYETAIERLLGYAQFTSCLLYTSPSPRDLSTSRMPSSA